MNILFKKEMSDYYTSEFSQMYDDLYSINKEKFDNTDKIIIESFGNTEKHIWKHFRKIIENLDIPTFFIEIKTNNLTVESYLNNDYNEKIKITFVDIKKINNTINDRFEYSDLICVNPFINLEINNNGSYGPCCEFQGKVGNYNAKYHGIDEVWDSKEIKEIRNNFLKGEWPAGCKKCVQLEQHGKISKRLRDNYYFQNYLYKVDWKNNKQNLISLDIKLGNACNLSCRICGPTASSLWYKEIKENLKDFGLAELPNVNLVNWPYDENGIFWQSFKKNYENIHYLQFVGGEPLMIKQHLAILEFLVNKGYAKDIFLHYNTNGTIWPSKKHFELYNKFSKVSFSLSIDNIDEKFEYERYGTTWKIVENNIEKFKNLNKNQYIVDVFTTVSIFNILDIGKVYNYFKDKDIEISFNLLETPKEFSIKNIPLHNRKKIIDKILLDNSDTDRYDFVFGILNNHSNYLELNKKFHQHISTVDKIRNQSYENFYPEMFEIMKNAN